VALATVALTCANAALSSAATRYWRNNAGNGNWNDATKWSSVSAADTNPANNGVPLAGEPVRIVHTDGTAHTVSLTTPALALGLVAIDLTGAGAAANTLSISNNLTSAAMFVGGHNGSATTNGRGAVSQSAGNVAMTSGTDLVLGYGAGSTGTYTLSGGFLTALQSEFIGGSGTGTFNHSGGFNTINEGAIGALTIGQNPFSTGTYNLSGSGQLESHKSVYVGDQGTGIFNHTGGTHTIFGNDDLLIGRLATGVGTYTISNNASLAVANNIVVGVSGTGTLNINDTSSVYVINSIGANSTGTINVNGGTLRFSNYSGPAYNRINFNAGTIRLGGAHIYGGGDVTFEEVESHTSLNTIDTGRTLVIEGGAAPEPCSR
jgi:T5SS/PEP-CTERM-associated repeat protein